MSLFTFARNTQRKDMVTDTTCVKIALELCIELKNVLQGHGVDEVLTKGKVE